MTEDSKKDSSPGTAEAGPAPAKKKPALPAEPEDLHPYPDPNRRQFLLGTLGWFRTGWAAFAAASLATGGILQRFLFPNVLYEPPQVFKAGSPAEYPVDYVEERFKEKYACWVVRTSRDPGTGGKAGFYALTTVCTHLGCTPNWLASALKFSCPCHGSGFQISGINVEGPAPRPLERFRVVLADDGQLLVDKNVKFQQEKGDWTKPEAFLDYSA